MDHVITLLSGTWAQHAEWADPHSIFADKLKEFLDGEVAIERFRWSGRNSFRARAAAADALAPILADNLQRWPTATHTVVAHSHAGNVGMLAMEDEKLSRRVQLITLATPFLHV